MLLVLGNLEQEANTIAGGSTPMIFNAETPLLDYRGNQLTESVPGAQGLNEQVLVTLGFALERVLMFGGKPDDAGHIKHHRFEICKRIAAAKNGRFELSETEIESIDRLAAPFFSTAGYGALKDALDNPETTH